jgi:PPM family protein phosphatase
MRFSVFQFSHKGGREKNEDRMGYCHTHRSSLFLLADGMGGHPQGEVAAQLALHTISALYQKQANPELQDVKGFFNTAIMAAHLQILRYAVDRGLRDSPRTTLVVAVVQGGVAQWAHCGDSRLYFVRGGEVLARTRDHSYLEQQRNTRYSSGLPPGFNRNLLHTCLGSPTRPVCDFAGPMPMQPGDKLLLCSDGLWDSLDDADIVSHLSQQAVPVAALALAEHALAQAGDEGDNVTLVAMEWDPPCESVPNHGNVCTQDVDNTVFVSTVRTDLADIAIDDLDDEAIEHAIAEINTTIRRLSVRRS